MKIVKLTEYQKEDLGILIQEITPEARADLFSKFINGCVYERSIKVYRYWLWASPDLTDLRDYYYYAMIKQEKDLL
jgi:hypothetical protein